MKEIAKCPFCGKLYKIYNYTVVDQSACPKCIKEAEKFKEERKQMKEINITITGKAMAGKTGVAYAIKHMLNGYGIDCEVSGCEDEIVKGDNWQNRIAGLGKAGKVNITTVRK